MMLEKFKISFFIVVGSYALLVLASYLFNGEFDTSIIGMWGLILGLLMLIAALPLHKIVFFGGRGIMGVQSPEIPGDEHLHNKIHKSYEKEHKEEISINRPLQDVLSLAGIIIILISLFMV
ncbi:hypothetical protein [Mesobacillus selenatarsenatis]|uniref:hypothetical protein n=1 Tax=Mesobacillus selenatarsenatis TaxID=388741 RepID=UPI0014356780|nr:hypothetical protein [Mesobacillus selenatarsenatis]